MKRFVIIALLLLAIGAFVLGPLLNGSSSSVNELAATFVLKENFLSTYGKTMDLEFTINKDVEKVEIIYNDSVFKTWVKPTGKLTIGLRTDYYGVGAKTLTLRSYLTGGGTEEDTRIVRILSDISPTPLKTEVIASFPHLQTSYTQGLEFDGNQLYEGTGNPQNSGESMIASMDLKTGKPITKNALDATYFGEGITIFGDEVYQLTWQNGKCFVYDKKTMQLKHDIAYSGEGWGLCNDGKNLIMSDGSERITFRDPVSFAPVKTIEVYDNAGPIARLNELEYFNGKIYANIYTTDYVAVIDPQSGKVLEMIDAAPLATVGKMGGEVLNGIAYNKNTNQLYMTGKNWGKVMEVKLVAP